ncbi:hypothetical protein [Zavarzinia sp.]|uniref:hypothetical protein n=1 Tax=Zavarzinia sp. TaxID=2027920 RepID=UPI0035669889
MTENAQQKAVSAYRARQGERGLVRVEVTVPEADRAVIRGLARRLVEGGEAAAELRTAAGEEGKTGSILAALRRSPLVGADLDLTRPRGEGRAIEL